MGGKMEQNGYQKHFAVFTLFVQIIFIVVFFVFGDVSNAVTSLIQQQQQLKSCQQNVDLMFNILQHEINLFNACDSSHTSNHHDLDTFATVEATSYGNVMFMVVFGFGFAYSIIAYHNLSSLCGTVFIVAVGSQWGIICRSFSRKDVFKIHMDISSIFGGISSSSVVLVSWGCVLGKLNFMHLLVLVLLEIPTSTLTEWLAISVLQAKDVGGSMLRHEYGGYFGLALSMAFHRGRKQENEPNFVVNFNSGYQGLIGTICFTLLWPLAVSAPLHGSDKQRVVLNIYLSMLSSCVTTFAMSSFLSKNRKFYLPHIHDAMVSGGIAIGASADSMISPGGALLVGMCGSVIGVFGISYVHPFLANRMAIPDTVAIFSVHGLVGMFGGATSAVIAAISTIDRNGYGLYHVYPAMVPTENGTLLEKIKVYVPNAIPGLGLTSTEFAGYQILIVVMCAIIPIVCGTITGFILQTSFFHDQSFVQNNDDSVYWCLPSNETDHIHDEFSTQTVIRHVSVLNDLV